MPQPINTRGLAPVDPHTGTPKPAAAPQGDWGKASWGDVLKHGVSTFGSAAVSDAVQAGKGLYHAGQQFAGNEPSAPGAGRVLNSAMQLMSGRAPVGVQNGKLAYTGPTMADYARAPSDVAKGVGDVAGYYGSYLNEPGLKRHLATDMPGVALDAGLLATSAEGSEGALAARAATIENAARAARMGAAVPVMRGVGRVARMAGAADPVKLVAKGAGAATSAGARAIRGAQAGLDASQPFTPTVAAVVKRNFPHLTDADLAQPGFRQAMVSSFQRNGINDAAARQGMLQFHGPDMPTPRGPITQKAPPGPGRHQSGPSPAQQATDTAIANGKQQIADKADAMVGGGAPDPTALGASVRKAAADSTANHGALFKKADTQPGGVISGPGDADFTARLRDNLTKSFADAGFNPTAMANLPGLAATNKAAGNLLDVTKSFADAGQISFPDLEQVRRYGIGRDVPGMGAVDPTAAKAMRGAWDQTVQDHLDAGHVIPDTLPDAGTNYSDARSAYAQHQATFVNPKTANPVVKKAVGAPDPADDATFAGADDVSAQNAVNGALFKGSGANLKFQPNAQQAYNAVAALGPDAKTAMDNHIRQTVLGSDNGLVTDHPFTANNLVNSPVGASVFSPDEASQVRFLTSASDVLKPDYSLGQQGPGFWGGVGSVARHVGAAGLTGAAALALPPEARGIAEPFLAVAGAGVENKLIEPYFAGRNATRQLQGMSPQFSPASVAGGALDAAGAGAQAVERVGSPGVAIPRALNQQASATAAPPPAAPGALNQPDPGSTPYEDVPIDKAPAAAPSPGGAKIDLRGLQPVDPASSGAPVAGSDSYEDVPIDKPPRAEHAAGGLVVDMTQRLMKRAEHAQKAAQHATKPLLGLSDTTVAQALRVAQRGL